MHPFRPRWSLVRGREIFNFSKWLVLTNILTYARDRSDSLIVGKILGAATLGLYTVAHEIATMATSELVAPIRRALLPGYAKLAHDVGALRESFISGFALIMMIASPVAIGMGLVADPLVRLFLGDQWLAAIPMLQVLAIFGLLQISSSNIGPVFLALGRPRLVMIVTGLTVGIGIPLTIYATLRWGVTGTIWSLIATNVCAAIAWIVLAVRVIELSLSALFAAVWRTFAALAMMILIVRLVSESFVGITDMAWLPIILVSEIVSGAVAYIGAHLALWRLSGSPDGSERQALDVVMLKLKR
jgi:O-antigen/teichoic acid export membrane protein